MRQKDDKPDPSSGAVIITATIGDNVVSRAADTDWAQGDQIGIFSTIGDEVRPYVNLQYTTEGDGKFSGYDIYYNNPMTLIAYYPFNGEEFKLPGNNGIIEAKTDSIIQDPATQHTIDFLWDSKKGYGVDKDQVDFSATNTNVNFVFSHKMSKISFTFKSSKPVWRDGIKICDGVDVRTMVSYRIEGLGIEGTFDTRTGVCAIDETKREGLTIACEKLVTAEDAPEYDSTREMNSLIVFPQEKPQDTNFVLIVNTDEFHDDRYLQTYKCQLTFNGGKIEPGYHYKFSVLITKMGLIVGDMTIDPWKSSADKSLTATIDGDPNFKPTDDPQDENQ